MQATCTACGAHYKVPESSVGRTARCKKCGESFVVEVPAVTPPPLPREEPVREPRRSRELGETGSPRDSRPWPVMVLAVLVLLAAAERGRLAMGETSTALSADAGAGEAPGFRIVGIFGATALAFLVIGIGLLRGKTWAWWCGVLLHGGNLALNAKFAYFWLSSLNWDHPRAAGIARGVAMRHGLPIAFALVSLVFLFLPSVRLFFGMKDKPRATRRKRAGRVRP